MERFAKEGLAIGIPLLVPNAMMTDDNGLWILDNLAARIIKQNIFHYERESKTRTF